MSVPCGRAWVWWAESPGFNGDLAPSSLSATPPTSVSSRVRRETATLSRWAGWEGGLGRVSPRLWPLRKGRRFAGADLREEGSPADKGWWGWLPYRGLRNAFSKHLLLSLNRKARRESNVNYWLAKTGTVAQYCHREQGWFGQGGDDETSNLELENKIKFPYNIRGDVETRQKRFLFCWIESSYSLFFENLQVLHCFIWRWFTLVSWLCAEIIGIHMKKFCFSL